jgi:hypothetical protein
MDNPLTQRKVGPMSTAATAVIALAIAGVLVWKNKAPKLVAFLTLVGGASITGGIIGEWLAAIVAWSSSVIGALTSQTFGVAVPAVATIVLLLIYAIDMWPKHTANRATAVIGLFLPAVAVAMPGEAGTAVAQFVAMTSQAGSTFLATVTGGA